MSEGLPVSQSLAGKPRLRCYYWQENCLIGNLGDALTPIFLKLMGYTPVSCKATGLPATNAGSCLIMIGSLLTRSALTTIGLPLDVWGCGWKGKGLPREILAQLRVYAVRGPHTLAGLNLPADTPLGDPALLLPQLLRRPVRPHGCTLVMPHFSRARSMPVQTRRRLTGCDEMVSPQVIQTNGRWRRGWMKQILSFVLWSVRSGIPPHTVWGATERIAGAAFVLTGSLHGAILAQSYGVPWAAYADGYVDAPPKWLDWAAYLNIESDFVSTLAEGLRWWEQHGRHGRIRDLSALWEAFPYPRIRAFSNA